MPKKKPEPRKKTSAMPLVVAVMLFAAAVALAVIYRGSDEPTETAQAPFQSAPPPASTPSQPGAERLPPPSLSMNAGWPADLPPLPALNFPPPRPREVVQAVYQFAVRHPEVLDYVPCFCGCEHSGHTDNTDCFVKSRDASGRITWDDHGLT